MEQGGGDVGQLEPFHIPISRVLISQSPKRRVQSVPLVSGSTSGGLATLARGSIRKPSGVEIKQGFPQAV